MKFVCENCKAKYQIGDDKVAGKTLRMKCRRCGHMIQVNATVTESSVSKLNPAAPPRAELHVGQVDALGSEIPRPAAEDKSDDDGATVVRPSPLFMRGTGTSLPAVGAPRPGAPPRAVPAPRPSSVRPPAAPPRPADGAAPGASTRPSARPPATGIAVGFSRAVAAPGASIAPQAPPAEDWYVGVGGVPLGPVRLSVIREKAAAGVVDGESLVWREGFEEWQPLKAFPALLAIIDEVRNPRIARPTPLPGSVSLGASAAVAKNGERPAAARPDYFGASATSATPSPAPMGTASPAPGGAMLRSSAVPEAPASSTNGSSATPPPASSVPFSLVTPATNGASAPGAAPAESSSSQGAGAVALGVLADPFAAPKPAVGANGASLEAKKAVEPRSSYGLESAGAASVLSPQYAGPASVPPVAQQRKMHPMAWAFIAMCAAFGGVAAWAVFLHKPPQQPLASATAPTSSTGSQPLLGPAPPPPTSVGDIPNPAASQAAVAGTSNTPQPGPWTGGTAHPAKSSDPGAPIDRGGFGVGPSTGPNATSDTGNNGGGKGQLSEGEIQGVVNRNKPGISRRCWDPAFEASDGNVKSAKVTASATIGPSGSVQSVNASGGDHFPGLASCIAVSIKGWTFPPSDGTTSTVIPFGFNRQ